MKKENFLIQTIFPYVGLWGLFAASFWKNEFLIYQKYLFLWLLLLILKDIFIHFIQIKPLKIKVLKTSDEEVWFFSRLIIFNRKKFFPSILIIYIVQLLVKQTNIWDLQNLIIFQIFSDNFLLIWVVISGILTLLKENLEEKYEEEIESMDYSILGIILSFSLSLLWAYMILSQTMRLGNLSYIIALISGLLIFLIWVMILEEEKE